MGKAVPRCQQEQEVLGSPEDRLPGCCCQLHAVGRLMGTGNALAGGLSRGAPTGGVSLIPEGLAIAEDFDPLGSLSSSKTAQR